MNLAALGHLLAGHEVANIAKTFQEHNTAV